MYVGCVFGRLDMYICVVRSADKILIGSVCSAEEVYTDFTWLFRLHSTTFSGESWVLCALSSSVLPARRALSSLSPGSLGSNGGLKLCSSFSNTTRINYPLLATEKEVNSKGRNKASTSPQSPVLLNCACWIVNRESNMRVNMARTHKIQSVLIVYSHRLIIALFDWGRKWTPLEMVIYTSNFTTQTTMYVDFYNCLVF